MQGLKTRTLELYYQLAEQANNQIETLDVVRSEESVRLRTRKRALEHEMLFFLPKKEMLLLFDYKTKKPIFFSFNTFSCSFLNSNNKNVLKTTTKFRSKNHRLA